MKVLLDENLPHKLRHSIGNHDVATVGYLDWNGLKNGELLAAAEASEFEVFVTGDKSLSYQQNIAGRRIALVTLSAHNWPISKHFLGEIAEAIDRAQPGSFISVDCGVDRRPT